MLKARKKLISPASFSLLLFLCITPSLLYAPDYDPQAAHALSQAQVQQHAPVLFIPGAQNSQDSQDTPPGVSYYLEQYGHHSRVPVLGADRRVLKFIFLGPQLVQED